MEPSRPNAPMHLWLVGLLATFLFGWGALFGIWFLTTGALTAAVDFVWVPALVAGAAGAIALPLRRRAAGPLFAIAGTLGLLSLGFLLTPASPDQPGAMIIAVNGLMLAAGGGALLIYARAMARRGVLR